MSKLRSDSGSPCNPEENPSAAAGRVSRPLVSIIMPFDAGRGSTRANECMSGRRGGPGLLYRLQIGTIPRNRNMCAAFRQIVKDQLRAAALEQALRDEDAEPHMVRRTGARRNIRLAEPPEQMQREPRPVIGDLDGDRRLVPKGGDADFAAGELDRVLNEIVEPVHDLGAAPNERLLGPGLSGRRKDQLHPVMFMKGACRLDQRGN